MRIQGEPDRIPSRIMTNHLNSRIRGKPEHTVYSVEFIRFAAAFTVIIWHYQFFFFPPAARFPGFHRLLPFYPLSEIFYSFGAYAVQLFWVLSGYIFFLNYHDLLASNKISGYTFFVRRIARLYPLNVLTLMAVAALQIGFLLDFHERYWHYDVDLSFHTFITHLFFASNWFNTEYTFNGPIWSVSVEVFIYIFFFMLTKYVGFQGSLKTTLIAAAAIIAYYSVSQNKHHGTLPWITQCLACFYIGGLVYYLEKHRAMLSLNRKKQVTFYCLILFSILVTSYLKINYAAYFYIPAAILFLAITSRNLNRFRVVMNLSWLGNLTYGSYLLHFPVALLIIIGVKAIGINLNIAYSPVFLVVYV